MSFTVEIDEDGVSRLQSVPGENRDLAGSIESNVITVNVQV